MWFELIKEFLADLRTHRTRALLTLVAITWGTITVVLLLSFGEGLGNRMQAGTLNAGNRIMILYGGETGKQFEGMPKGRKIRMVEDDVEILAAAIPMIARISPQYMDGVELAYGRERTNTTCEGVNPEFEEMRRMYPMAGGRFLNSVDVAEQRRVVVLGVKIAGQLFGTADPIGLTLQVNGLPFRVVGVLQDKLQTSMNNGPDTYRVIMPYTTFRTTYGPERVNSIVVSPSDPSQQLALKSEIFRVLARKYHFDPTDERTLFIWDFLEQEKMGQKISFGMSIFLGGMGFLTLLIGGVGVANVMYVVVKERTREIGIRLAVGARKIHIMAQIIFEALLLAFLGGGAGILVSWGVVALVRSIPAADGPMQFFNRPELSPGILLLTTGILAFLGLLAGYFPARKAASLDPVESLRYE